MNVTIVSLTPWPLFPLEMALVTHRIGVCGDRRVDTGILKEIYN
jgi:hypothetical protein